MLDFVFVTLRFITVKWGVLSRLIWSISPLTLHCLNDVSMCFFFFCFILVFYFSTITIGIFCFTHFTLSCIYTKSLFLYHISSCILLLLFLLVECKCFFFLFRAVLVSITLLSMLLLSWKISLESHTFARTHTIKKMKSSVLLAEQIRPLVQISQALIQIHTKFLAHSLTQFHFYKPTTHSFHFASFC